MKNNQLVVKPCARAGAFALFALAAISPAAAQTDADSAAGAHNVAEPAAGDIVVTANKRKQALKDVGMTATVLSAQDIANRKIVSLADIATTIPGLSYSASENNTPVFTLRGVGFNEASLAAYPTVSVYIDEAPLAFPVLATQGAFDLERIEVLKGPQGTLFGQNSTGGAINYIAAKPTDTLAAGVDASYSRFNTFEANAFISGPINDQLKVRVAGHYIRSDDWQRSYTRNDTLGRTLAYAGRAIVDWKPSDRARFALSLNAWKDKSDPQAGQLVALFPQGSPTPIPGVVNYPYPPMNARAADWSSGTQFSPNGLPLDPRPQSDRRLLQAALRGDVDVTNDITFTSQTAYVDLKQQQSQDYDGQATNNDDIPSNNGSIKSFFQEVRLANNPHDAVRVVLGANYQRSRIIETDSISYADATTSVPALNNIIENGYKSNTLRRDYAFFANAEVDIVPRVTLKAGGRYTNNLTSIYNCNYDLGDGRINGLFTVLSRAISGNPALPALTPGSCISLSPSGIPGPVVDQLHQSNISWRGGIDYKLSRNALFYLNVSRGFKAGSYPTISASAQSQITPVTQESVLAYEGGFKLNSANRAFSLNGAAFYYDYRNKQIRGKVLDPIFGVLNALVNVPKSRLYGFELEGTVRPLTGLSLTATVTYVNSKVERYSGTNVVGQFENFAGSRIPFSPQWQGQVDGEYRWNQGALRPFVGGTINARSATSSYIGGEYIQIPAVAGASTAPGVTYPFAIKGYATLDLRAGAELEHGVRVMVWCKNVTNTYYWQNVISAFDTAYRLAARPATYGITVSWKY